MKVMILFVFFSLTTFQERNSVRIVENHIKAAEAYFNPNQKDKQIFDISYLPSIEFLENLTGIACDKSKSQENVLEPSRKNIVEWKSWLKENKKKIYWSKNLKKVMVKSTKANNGNE